ncbi:MAG: VOC family protein [Planctomycetota bacterium]|jgi:hypothetical protein
MRGMADYFVPSKQHLRRLERLEIEPRDFNATARFWRRLGFQVTIQGDTGRRTAALRAGEVRLLFRESGILGDDRRRTPFLPLRVVISVRAFDECLAELAGKNITLGPEERTSGFARAVEVIDPNGIRLLVEDGEA